MKPTPEQLAHISLAFNNLIEAMKPFDTKDRVVEKQIRMLEYQIFKVLKLKPSDFDQNKPIVDSGTC